MSVDSSVFGILSGRERTEKLLGRAAVSIAGHDAGKIYFIVGVVNAGLRDEMILLADGRARKTAKPKAKKAMHLRVLPIRSERVAEALIAGRSVDDSVIVHELKSVRLDPDCD